MTKAYQAAKEVIDATNEDGSKKYKLGTVNDITNKDYSFSVEHIMAVYDYDLYDRASKSFTESATYAKDEALIANNLYDPGSTDDGQQFFRKGCEDIRPGPESEKCRGNAGSFEKRRADYPEGRRHERGNRKSTAQGAAEGSQRHYCDPGGHEKGCG